MPSYTDGIYDNSKMGNPLTLCYSLSSINNYFKLESVGYLGPIDDTGNQVVGLLYDSASFSLVGVIGRKKSISISNSTYGGTTVITQVSGARTPKQVSLITKNNNSFTFNIAASGNASDEAYIYSPFEYAIGNGSQNNGIVLVGLIENYNPEVGRFDIYGDPNSGTYIQSDGSDYSTEWFAYLNGVPYNSSGTGVYPWDCGYYGDAQDGISFTNGLTYQLTTDVLGPNKRRLCNLNG